MNLNDEGGEPVIGILVSFGLLFATGAYFLASEWLKLPTWADTRVIMQATKPFKRKSQLLEAIVSELSTRLAPLIPLSDYKRRKTEAILKSAGVRMTPAAFYAKAIVKSGLIALSIFPCLLIFPLLSPLLLFLAIGVYFKDIQSADRVIRKKREQIEYELPRFAATIAQELKATRDVLLIMETYRKNAGESLASELEITIADMKSGNHETALTRLETRMGSTMLSDIVRGLLAVQRGDQGVVYFEMLAHDFKLLEIQRLKLIAMKRPGKIRKYSFYMLGCFLLMYLVIIGMEIMKALGKLF